MQFYKLCRFSLLKQIKTILRRFNNPGILHFTIILYDYNCEEKKKQFLMKAGGILYGKTVWKVSNTGNIVQNGDREGIRTVHGMGIS